MRYRRVAGTAVAGVALVLLLTGCSQVNTFLHSTFPDQFGPERGSDGRVEAQVAAHSYYLEIGDCFDFPDDSNHNEVTIIPCDQDHVFQVIGQGELTLEELTTLGDQAAASADCADAFTAFKQNAPAGSHPDQEFVITQAQQDGKTVTKYSCAATLTRLPSS